MCVITDFNWSTEFQTQFELTVVLSQSFGDLTEDPGVAGDHDDQRQQEQAGEGEHVVGRLVPVPDETSTRGALSEVLGVDDGHVVKKEHLRRKPRNNYYNCLLPSGIDVFPRIRGCFRT